MRGSLIVACLLMALLISVYTYKNKQMLLGAHVHDTDDVTAINTDNLSQQAIKSSKSQVPYGGQDNPDGQDLYENIQKDESHNAQHVECKPFDYQLEASLTKQREAYLASLSSSTNQDEQLAFAIFTEHDENSIKTNILFSLLHIKSPLYAIELLKACTNNIDNPNCTNQVIQEVAQLHKNDSAVWIEAAHYFVKTEQHDQITAAIEQARQSVYSSSHIAEFVILYTETLENAGFDNYISNVSSGLGMAHMNLPDYSHIMAWCSRYNDDPTRAQACLYLGQQLETYESNEYAKSIGLEIQKLVYEFEKNPKLAQQVTDKKIAMESLWRDDTFIHGLNTIHSNEDLLRKYFAFYAQFGERFAIASLQSDVEDYRRSEYFKQCGNLF